MMKPKPNKWMQKNGITKTCVKCGQDFKCYWKHQKHCETCINEKRAYVNSCYWCREELRTKQHFCSENCDMEYGALERKIILGFPLSEIKYELLVLRKSGKNYRGLEKLCVQQS